MKKLSFESITSFVGDVLPIRLTSDKEDLSSCDIKWECTGDAAVLRTFSGDGEYSFADGALIVLVKEGVACVSAMLDGVRYSAEVVAKAAILAELESVNRPDIIYLKEHFVFRPNEDGTFTPIGSLNQ